MITLAQSSPYFLCCFIPLWLGLIVMGICLQFFNGDKDQILKEAQHRQWNILSIDRRFPGNRRSSRKYRVRYRDQHENLCERICVVEVRSFSPNEFLFTEPKIIELAPPTSDILQAQIAQAEADLVRLRERLRDSEQK